jgi:hypothetical protein
VLLGATLAALAVGLAVFATTRHGGLQVGGDGEPGLEPARGLADLRAPLREHVHREDAHRAAADQARRA